MTLVMGTAGHIDHGKTSLIRILTGIDCDRLHEEKKRGITIELGFAYFDVPTKDVPVKMGVIDVPGHERFVRNMVAGATGIDFVLMVIAADEGVMPQTREHLEICSILNIKVGMIALTKIDMVDDDLLELAIEDIKDFTQNTFLENAPIFPVSSLTGRGIDELRQAIYAQNDSLIPQRRNDIFRLPIDRVFTLKGHGTLVTGTVWSGQAQIGNEIEIMPKGLMSRIRSIQNHGQSVELAQSGQRISINTTGLEVSDLNRGDVISLPKSLYASKRWLIALHCLKSSPRPLKHRKEVHFHHGAKELSARIYFYTDEKVQPGESILCEVRFSEPVTGVFGDKCVIRSFSPLQTVAGATILNPLEDFPKRKQINQLGEEWQEKLLNLPEFFNKNPLEAIFSQIYLGHNYGISLKQLTLLTPFEEKKLTKYIQELSAKKRVFQFDKENPTLICHEYVEALCQSFKQEVQDFHKKEPLKTSMPKASLLSSHIPSKLAYFIVEKLTKQGDFVQETDGIRLKEHNIALQADHLKRKENILASFKKNPSNPPLLKELVQQEECSQKEVLDVLQLLINDKIIIKVTDGMYFLSTEIHAIQKRMLDFYKNNSSMTPTDFKEISGGLSRKYSIPVLEYFDKEKITMRVGEGRQLRNMALLSE